MVSFEFRQKRFLKMSHGKKKKKEKNLNSLVANSVLRNGSMAMEHALNHQVYWS